MLIEKIQDLKVSPKAAIECGSIFFADRQVDIDIFVRRDEADQNPLFYVVFDQPKKYPLIKPRLGNLRIAYLLPQRT
jgi:hypothetical protein